MSWNFDDNEKVTFTKFPVGATLIRILDDSPHTRWTHWMPQYRRSINCPGKGCPICEIRRKQKANGDAYSYQMARKLAINVYNYELGKAEIMEQGITFFEDLRDVMTDLKAKGIGLRNAVLRVKRRGTTKDDTSYRIDIEREEPAGEKELAAMDAMPDLKEYFKPHTPEQILAVINVRASSQEEFMEAWNNAMNTGQQEDDATDSNIGSDEEFEVK